MNSARGLSQLNKYDISYQISAEKKAAYSAWEPSDYVSGKCINETKNAAVSIYLFIMVVMSCISKKCTIQQIRAICPSISKIIKKPLSEIAAVQALLTGGGKESKWNDETFVEEQLKTNFDALLNASLSLRNSADFIYRLAERVQANANQYCIEIIGKALGPKLKSNLNFAQKLVELDYRYIKYVDKEIGKEVTHTFLDNQKISFDLFKKNIDDDLKNDIEIMKKAANLFGPEALLLVSDQDIRFTILHDLSSTLQGKVVDRPKVPLFHNLYYPIKSERAKQITYGREIYVFLKEERVPYPVIEKIKTVAVIFFSFGIALFSARVRRNKAALFDKERIRAIYRIENRKIELSRRSE